METQNLNPYGPIAPELPEGLSDFQRRVILFDPTDIYSRIQINPYRRHQDLDMQMMWPNFEPGKCACGCGAQLTGRQTRWAGEEHSRFPLAIYHIIRGDLQVILYYLTLFMPHACSRCECKNTLTANCISNLQVDHILAVCNGGGGAWLGNYQILCVKCHGPKSGADRSKKKKPIIQSQKLLL